MSIYLQWSSKYGTASSLSPTIPPLMIILKNPILFLHDIVIFNAPEPIKLDSCVARKFSFDVSYIVVDGIAKEFLGTDTLNFRQIFRIYLFILVTRIILYH